jgi:hypothetical protein
MVPDLHSTFVLTVMNLVSPVTVVPIITVLVVLLIDGYISDIVTLLAQLLTTEPLELIVKISHVKNVTLNVLLVLVHLFMIVLNVSLDYSYTKLTGVLVNVENLVLLDSTLMNLLIIVNLVTLPVNTVSDLDLIIVAQDVSLN